MKFLVQTVEGRVRHDFSFALLEAIDYKNWFHRGNVHEYYLADNILEYDFTDYIPCGTIEFVESFLNTYHGIKNVKPINIPKQLMKKEYLKRNVKIKNINDIVFDGERYFIKSMDKIKGFRDIVRTRENAPDGTYLVSDVIDIQSEWRAFVYDGELVGLQNYSGDFTLFPDVEVIKSMIREYKDAPPCYTLDVGVHSKLGTFLIEVGYFFSSGLYGFNDSRLLPTMYVRDFRYVTEKFKSEK